MWHNPLGSSIMVMVTVVLLVRVSKQDIIKHFWEADLTLPKHAKIQWAQLLSLIHLRPCTETSSTLILNNHQMDPRVMYWQGEKIWCFVPSGNFTLETSTGGVCIEPSVSVMRWKCCIVNAPFTSFTHKATASDLRYPEAVPSLNTDSDRRCTML